MKRIFFNFLSLLMLAGVLSSCFGDHNKSVTKGVNKNDTRIYGPSRDAEPVQLQNQYEDDETGETAERIQNIREAFFPK